MAATIDSIIGLQNLTNLQEFRADYNSLTTIDLSGMSSLTYVDISDNDYEVEGRILTSINLSGCTSLEQLRLDDNDFSGEFPDLSDCTSLLRTDFDDCGLIGSVDISNLLTLESFDFSDNEELTELIISRNQPLGTSGDLNVDDCALTQTAVDNILVELSLSSVNNGYIDLSGGTNAVPSSTGVAALAVLQGKGWNCVTNF
jgi:hypothetical protein